MDADFVTPFDSWEVILGAQPDQSGLSGPRYPCQEDLSKEGEGDLSFVQRTDCRGVGLRGVPTLSLVAVRVLGSQGNALEEVWELVLD